jgi:hypothetical protein
MRLAASLSYALTMLFFISFHMHDFIFTINDILILERCQMKKPCTLLPAAISISKNHIEIQSPNFLQRHEHHQSP